MLEIIDLQLLYFWKYIFFCFRGQRHCKIALGRKNFNSEYNFKTRVHGLLNQNEICWSTLVLTQQFGLFQTSAAFRIYVYFALTLVRCAGSAPVLPKRAQLNHKCGGGEWHAQHLVTVTDKNCDGQKQKHGILVWVDVIFHK